MFCGLSRTVKVSIKNWQKGSSDSGIKLALYGQGYLVALVSVFLLYNQFIFLFDKGWGMWSGHESHVYRSEVSKVRYVFVCHHCNACLIKFVLYFVLVKKSLYIHLFASLFNQNISHHFDTMRYRKESVPKIKFSTRRLKSCHWVTVDSLFYTRT